MCRWNPQKSFCEDYNSFCKNSPRKDATLSINEKETFCKDMKSQCKETKLSSELIMPICKDIKSFCKIEEIKVSSEEIKLSSGEIKSFCKDIDLYLEDMKSQCEEIDLSNAEFLKLAKKENFFLKKKMYSNEEKNVSPPENSLLLSDENKSDDGLFSSIFWCIFVEYSYCHKKRKKSVKYTNPTALHILHELSALTISGVCSTDWQKKDSAFLSSVAFL